MKSAESEARVLRKYHQAITALACMLLILAALPAAPGAAAPFPIATGGASINSAFDGTNYLVGVENHQTSPTSIGAQRIDASGNKVGALISIGTPYGNGTVTNAAFDGANYLLIWEYDPGGTGAGRFQIYGQFISKAGVKVGSPFAISTPGIFFDGSKTMAFGGGKYLVTYSRLINPDDSYDRYIAGRIVSPDGTMGDEFRISSGSGRESDVAFDGANFFVVWCKMDINGYGYEIRSRFVSPAGVPGTEISVNNSAARSDNPKSVAFDGTNYMVIWNDEVGGLDSGEWDVLGQRVSTSGGKVGDVITINSEAGRQLGTTVAFDGTYYLTTWMDMAYLSDWNLFGQYINQSGTLVGSKVTISTAAGNQLGGTGFVNGRYLALINNGVVMGERHGITAVTGADGLFITPVSAPAAPTITSLGASSGAPGNPVIITGANYVKGATTVIFNGTLSTAVTVTDSGHLTAYIPSGATTGPIRVTTSGGTATSSSFTITGAGITFNGFVTDLFNSPISAAKIEMVGNPNLWTLSDSTGHYSLSGFPSGTTFVLKISKDGYLPFYSAYLNFTTDVQLPDMASTVLWTPAQAAGWGPSAKGFIAAKIMNESFSAMLSGAVVTATGANGTSYPVTYWDGGATWRDTSTYSNGVAIVKNVTDGDTVTLQVTSHESSYAQLLPIHANAESGALLSGKVISTRSGNISTSPTPKDFGSVMVGGSSDTQIFNIYNSGPGDLTLLSTYWIGDPTPFSPSLPVSNPCSSWPGTLHSGESCNVAATFIPPSVGTQKATFVVNSSAVNTPVYNSPLSGTGVAPYNLTINITGGGTVNNYSTDFIGLPFTPCSQPSCSYQFGAGSVFDLEATPAESLKGWSGSGSASACSGTGHCQFTLNAITTVTAPFNPRIKIHGNGSEYQWLKDAYGAANDNAQIDARNMTFIENFSLNRSNVNIRLKGGLQSDFTTINGYSYLQGIMTVVAGSLTVENLCIK